MINIALYRGASMMLRMATETRIPPSNQ